MNMYVQFQNGLHAPLNVMYKLLFTNYYRPVFLLRCIRLRWTVLKLSFSFSPSFKFIISISFSVQQVYYNWATKIRYGQTIWFFSRKIVKNANY